MSIRLFLYGMPEQIRVLQQMLAKAEGISIVGGSSNENEVLEGIRRVKADVMLAYVDGSASTYRIAQQVYMLCPQCLNFALAPAEILEKEAAKIYSNGIHYVYEHSVNTEELVSYIKSAYSVEAGRRTSLEEGKTNMISSKVLTFYSPKDGLGRSTFIMSYAVELSKRKQKVCVLDFDLQFGDIHILTNIETKETLAEMLQERSTPTLDIIQQYITFHKSGVNILCAPRSVEYADKIQAQQLEKIISSLRSYYDYILIDAATAFDELTYVCCEQASEVYIAVRPDISMLHHAKKVVSMFEALGQKEKIKLLYFNFIKVAEITADTAAKVLGVPVWQTVPYDLRTAVMAMNQGDPVAIIGAKTPIARACAKAAEETVRRDEVVLSPNAKKESKESKESSGASKGLFSKGKGKAKKK